MPAELPRDAAPMPNRSADTDEALVRAFRRRFWELDTDENGLLNREEVGALADWVYTTFKPMGKHGSAKQAGGSHQAGKLFHLLDRDGDGMVSFDEFEVPSQFARCG